MFEELDLAYVGVIDGHDVTALRDALEDALAADRPVVVHIQTVKGKGFAPAEEGGLEGMEKWHAAKPHSIVNRKPAPPAKPKTPATDDVSPGDGAEFDKVEKPAPPPDPPQYTQVFADAMVDEATRDRRVIGITAAMAGGTGLSKLAKELPGQYYDVGIAEQDALLLASGLALQGAKPVCAIYSTFLQRAYDQIVHDVCLQELDVVFAMDRAGLVGDDGPTHHGAYRHLLLPLPPQRGRDGPTQRGDAGPHAPYSPRSPRPDRPALPPRRRRGGADARAPEVIAIGTGEVLREGERVALLGYGYGVTVALGAAEVLAARGITATVADGRFAKPLDTELATRLAAEHDLVVTIEEGSLPGGFGSAVLEHVEDTFASPGTKRARILRVGIPDRYVTHGKPALLREEAGLTGDAVAERVAAALGAREQIAD